jgi:hypothetical protein
MYRKLGATLFIILFLSFCAGVIAADGCGIDETNPERMTLPNPPPIFIGPKGPPPAIMIRSLPTDRAAVRLDQFMAGIACGGIQLNDEQVEALANEKCAFFDKAGPALLRVKSLDDNLRNALLKAEVDANEIVDISKQLSVQNQLLDDLFTVEITKVAKLLTSEQRGKMKLVFDRQELMPMGIPGIPMHRFPVP